MKRPMVRRSAGLTLADLLVVVVLIPVFLLAFVGCWRRNERVDYNWVKCASNLKQIGQSILMYSNENHGEYPRTRFVGGPKVIPTWGTRAPTTQPDDANGPDANDVTAGLFLLLKTQEITSEVFICPQSDAEKWDFGGDGKTAANWSNWDGAEGIKKHLSYSYQNPYPDDAALKNGFKLNTSIAANFAVAADINPGAGALKVRPNSSTEEMKQGNSPNHNHESQNVLFGDGHVEYLHTPFVGVNQDNIYARRANSTGYESSEIRNSPFDADDNVLLPTSE